MKTGVFYSGRQEGSCPHGPFPQPLRCAGGRCLAPRGWERGGDGVVGWWGNGRQGSGVVGFLQGHALPEYGLHALPPIQGAPTALFGSEQEREDKTYFRPNLL